MDTPAIYILIALGLPLFGSPFIALAGKKLGRNTGWLALAFPLLSTLALLTLAIRLPLPESTVIEWHWIPTLGISLSFLIDGLSLFFGLIVSGVGCLVFFYAQFYLDDHFRHHGRFYCYLTLFMAAMLGTVLANNLMMLFVFWELTGLASFLLIGFLHDQEGSRVGARQALLVTATTGLVMLAGIIMVYTITGTYSLSEMLGSGLPLAAHREWLSAAMVLILVGAFGKSAQFPFHFWLPNAMAAPTPVSAYLHSATMVKLGVFLCARIFPLFASHDLWPELLGAIGFTTMLLGAILALLSHDLKAILAFSTVSQLGFLIGYYGLGKTGGVAYDYLHILNHVFYKGCLFMVAGIVAHASGIRDIRQLGGMFRRLPWTGAAALIACAAMAGLPGTIGFVSKEMVLEEVFGATATHARIGWYAAGCVVLASLVQVAFAARLFANVFLGREPETVAKHFHAPSPGMQLPPLILASLTFVCGVFPGILERPFTYLGVSGLNAPGHLSLWHGFTIPLKASGIIVALGLGLYALRQRAGWRGLGIPRWLQFDSLFEIGLERFSKFTRQVTRFLRSDQPVDYLPIIIGFTVTVVGGTLAWRLGPELRDLLSPGHWPAVDWLRGFVAGLIALAIFGVVVLKRWTTQLISLSVAGFLVCFYFVLYRAPDLALTQILIEVVTLFMILILLGRFPRSAEQGEVTHKHPAWRNAVNVALALCVGGMMTVFILGVTNTPHPDRVGPFYLEQTIPLAEGSNPVNTILVDFRGFDTLGEITVLIIAVLGGLGLLMRYRRTAAEYKAGPMGPPGFGIGTENDPEKWR